MFIICWVYYIICYWIAIAMLLMYSLTFKMYIPVRKEGVLVILYRPKVRQDYYKVGAKLIL